MFPLNQLASFFLSTLVVVVVTALPVVDVPDNSADHHLRIPHSYVVQLRPHVRVVEHLSWARDLHARSLKKRSRTGRVSELVGVKDHIDLHTFQAYTAEFDEETVACIRLSDDVLHVEEDRLFHADDLVRQDDGGDTRFETNTRSLTTQDNAPWSLQYISQRPKAADANYYYAGTAGQGTWAYIVDSGINVDHEEFGGRAVMGYTAYWKDTTDWTGHGTHCAGIIGSHTYGVAKMTNLVGVKVLNDTVAPWSTILSGYAWAVNNIKAKGRIGKAVISISISGSLTQTINNAIAAAYLANITTIVSAGNNNNEVSAYSPASTADAITVGAITPTYTKAGYSNFGPGVDIYAPGTAILSTWIGGSTGIDSVSAVAKQSGTSMACPHVAGLALCLLSESLSRNDTALLSSQTLKSMIVEMGSRDAIQGLPNGTSNNFIYNGSGR